MYRCQSGFASVFEATYLVAVLTTGQMSLCCGPNGTRMAPSHRPNVAHEEIYLDSGSMIFSLSSSLATILTRALIAFIAELASNVLVVPVHTSSPSGLAVA